MIVMSCCDDELRDNSNESALCDCWDGPRCSFQTPHYRCFPLVFIFTTISTEENLSTSTLQEHPINTTPLTSLPLQDSVANITTVVSALTILAIIFRQPAPAFTTQPQSSSLHFLTPPLEAQHHRQHQRRFSGTPTLVAGIFHAGHRA